MNEDMKQLMERLAAAVDRLEASQLGAEQRQSLNDQRQKTLEALTDLKSAWPVSNETIIRISELTGRKLRSVKDENGKYLWRPGLAENAPDTFAGVEIEYID